MINTIEIKQQQLSSGTYKIGSGNEVVLIMGSCRAVPYLNYLNDWNKKTNRFTIHFIDPFNWNWDLSGNRVDYEAELLKQESNENLLKVLKSVNIFIHEYYNNAGMFNVSVEHNKKSIYHFGLDAKIDITLPNYNDIFVLTREIVSFDMNIRKMAIQDYNVNGKLSEQTIQEIEKVRNNNLDRFYKICAKTDFPEFADIFKANYKSVRMFWTFNHIAKAFSQSIFNLLNNKFLKLDLSNYKISEEDMYANNYTYLCEYDEGYEWNEEIKPLREIL